MMENILRGVLPTDVFKSILIEHSDYSNDDIGRLFSDEFPRAGIGALQTIWYWKYPGRQKGLSDEEVNQSIKYELMLAGYIVKS